MLVKMVLFLQIRVLINNDLLNTGHRFYVPTIPDKYKKFVTYVQITKNPEGRPADPQKPSGNAPTIPGRQTPDSTTCSNNLNSYF